MKKRMIAVLLLLSLALAAASCNPNNPYELLTNENGENNTKGGIVFKEFEDEEDGYGELIPLR